MYVDVDELAEKLRQAEHLCAALAKQSATTATRIPDGTRVTVPCLGAEGTVIGTTPQRRSGAWWAGDSYIVRITSTDVPCGLEVQVPDKYVRRLR